MLEEDAEASGATPSARGVSSRVCAKCRPILSRYSDIFKGLIHQGSELKKRKHLNPHPKRPDTTHYRDLNRQNDWIRENIFNPMGNYLFCCACILLCLHSCIIGSIWTETSSSKGYKKKAISRKQSQEPLRDLTKAEVASLDIAFNKWWSSLEPSHTVMVRYPHERHGNAGRKSNSSKGSVMEDFLCFIDINKWPQC